MSSSEKRNAISRARYRADRIARGLPYNPRVTKQGISNDVDSPLGIGAMSPKGGTGLPEVPPQKSIFGRNRLVGLPNGEDLTDSAYYGLDIGKPLLPYQVENTKRAMTNPSDPNSSSILASLGSQVPVSPINPPIIPRSAVSQQTVERTKYDSVLDEVNQRFGGKFASWKEGLHGRVLSIENPKSSKTIDVPIGNIEETKLGYVLSVLGKESDGETITEGIDYKSRVTIEHQPDQDPTFRVQRGLDLFTNAVNFSFSRAGTRGYYKKSPQEIFESMSADMVKRNEERVSGDSRVNRKSSPAVKRLARQEIDLVVNAEPFWNPIPTINNVVYGNVEPTYLDKDVVGEERYNRDVAQQRQLVNMLYEGGVMARGPETLVLGGGRVKNINGSQVYIGRPGVTGTRKYTVEKGSAPNVFPLEPIYKKRKIVGYNEVAPHAIVNPQDKSGWVLPNIADDETGEREPAALVQRLAAAPGPVSGAMFLGSTGKRYKSFGRSDTIIRQDAYSLSPLDMATKDIKFSGGNAGWGEGGYKIAKVGDEEIYGNKNEHEFYAKEGIIYLPALHKDNEWTTDTKIGISTDEHAAALRAKGHTVEQVFGLSNVRLGMRGVEPSGWRNRGRGMKATLTPTGAPLGSHGADLFGTEVKTSEFFRSAWGSMTNQEQINLTAMWAKEDLSQIQKTNLMALSPGREFGNRDAALQNLYMQIGTGEGKATSVRQMAEAGGYKDGGLGLLEDLFGWVDESRNDPVKQQQIADAGGFSYIPPDIYDIGPWSKEHYKKLRSDSVSVLMRKGSSVRDALKQFHQEFQYDRVGDETGILLQKVNRPHLLVDILTNQIGDPSSVGSFNKIAVDQLAHNYPEAKEALLSGVPLSRNQMANAGILRASSDRIDRISGLSTNSRIMDREEMQEVIKLAQNSEQNKLPPSAFFKGMSDILGNEDDYITPVQIGNKIFPSPVAIGAKQAEIGSEEYGLGEKAQNAIAESIRDELRTKEERAILGDSVSDADKREAAFYSQVDRSAVNMLKDLGSVKTANADYRGTYFAPHLGLFQMAKSPEVRKAQIRALAKEKGIPYKEAERLAGSVNIEYATRQYESTAYSSLDINTSIDAIRGASAARKRNMKRDAAMFKDRTAIGGAGTVTTLQDYDLDSLVTLSDFTVGGNGKLKSRDGGINLHGNEALDFLKRKANSIFPGNIQGTLESSQKALGDVFGGLNIVQKFIGQRKTFPTTLQMLMDTYSSASITSGVAWAQMINNEAAAEVIGGKQINSERNIVQYALGIDEPKRGNSDLASAYSSAKIKVDDKGNPYLQYAISRQRQGGNGERVVRKLTLDTNLETNIGGVGIRNLMKNLAVDATSDFGGEMITTKEQVAGMFSRGSGDEKQLLEALSNTEQSGWGKLVQDRIESSYSGLTGDAITDMDRQWTNTVGFGALMGGALVNSGDGDIVNQYDKNVSIPNGANQFAQRLTSAVSGGNTNVAGEQLDTYQQIASNIKVKRNFKKGRIGSNALMRLGQRLEKGISNSVVGVVNALGLDRSSVIDRVEDAMIAANAPSEPIVQQETPQTRALRLESILNDPGASPEAKQEAVQELGPIHAKLFPIKNQDIPPAPPSNAPPIIPPSGTSASREEPKRSSNIKHYDLQGNLIGTTDREDVVSSYVEALGKAAGSNNAATSASATKGPGARMAGWRRSVLEKEGHNFVFGYEDDYAKISGFSSEQIRQRQENFNATYSSQMPVLNAGVDQIVKDLRDIGINVPTSGDGTPKLSAVPDILLSMLGQPVGSTQRQQAEAMLRKNAPAIKAASSIIDKAGKAYTAEKLPSDEAVGKFTPDPNLLLYYKGQDKAKVSALRALETAIPGGVGKESNDYLEKVLRAQEPEHAVAYGYLAQRGLVGTNAEIDIQKRQALIGQLSPNAMANMNLLSKRVTDAKKYGIAVSPEQVAISQFVEDAKLTNPESFKESKDSGTPITGAIKDQIDALQKLKEALLQSTNATEGHTKGLSAEEKQIRAINQEQGRLIKSMEKPLLEQELKDILSEGVTPKNRGRLETVSRDLEAIYKSEDQTKKPFNLAEFGRDIFGGWGLMYARSIAGFATSGIGQGAEENLKMRQAQAQARYGVLGTAQAPYDQNMALQNTVAVNGANLNGITGVQMWAAQNRGISEIGQLGIAGASAAAYSGFLVRDTPWGRMQSDEKTATHGTTRLTKGLSGLAQLDLAVAGGIAVTNVLAEGYARSQDPVGLGLRQGRGDFSLYDRMGTVMSAMGSGENWQQTKKYTALGDYISQGGRLQNGYGLSQDVRNWAFGGVIKESYNYSSSDLARGYGEQILKQYPQLPAEVAGQLGAMEQKFGWNLSRYNLGSTNNMMGAYANDLRMGGMNIQTGGLMANSGGQGIAYAQQQMTVSNPTTDMWIDSRFSKLSTVGMAARALGKDNGDGTWTTPTGEIINNNGQILQKGDPNAKSTQSRQASMELLGAMAATETESRPALLGKDESVLANAAMQLIAQLSPLAQAQYGIKNLPTTAEEYAEAGKKYGSTFGSWNLDKQQSFMQTANMLSQMTPNQLSRYGGVWKTDAEISAMSPDQMNAWNMQTQSSVGAAQSVSQQLVNIGTSMIRYGSDAGAVGKMQQDILGMSGGAQELAIRAMNMDPLAMATLAQGGMNIGALPGVQTIQGLTVNANYATMADVNEGRLTGLSYGTTGLALNSLTSQQVGANIYGTKQNKYIDAAVNGYKLANPLDLGNGTMVESVGGLTGAQYAYEDTMYGFQQQGLAIQQAQLTSSWAHTQTMWKIQDKQIALSNWYQTEQFGLQQEQINMSRGNIATGNAIQQKQMDFSRAWAQEDWGYQDTVRNLQWGWKQEDYAEESRFMTGRQRKLAERQMGRETTLHNLEGDQIDKQRARQEELWKLEDQRFDLQKKQQLESLNMQQKQLDLQKQYFEEQKKLQAQQVKEERKYQAEQHKFQVQQLALQMAQAKEQREYQLMVRETGLFIQMLGGQLNTLSDDGMNKLRDGLAGVLDQIEAIYQAGMNGPSVTGHAMGGSLATGASVVGERGWEYIIDGQVLSHEQSVSMTDSRGYSNDTSFIFNSRNNSGNNRPQVINVYIGEHKIESFILDAVTKELRT